MLGFFNDGCMPEISAVIFNHLATWGKTDALCNEIKNVSMDFQTIRTDNFNIKTEYSKKKDYKESLLDGMQIYHNPYAQYPIEENFFKHKDVAQCFGYKPGTDCLVYDGDDGSNYNNGFLLFRSVTRRHSVLPK